MSLKRGSASWYQFWKEKPDLFDAVMEISTMVAARRLDSYLKFQRGHDVLDFGCGPGFLVKYLLQKEVHVVGADINGDLVNKNRERFPGAEFVHLNEAHEASDSLKDALGERRFDYIILLSVLQYFDTATSVEEIISVLQQWLKPTGKLIIADVVNSRTSSMRDATAVYIECLRRGRGSAFVRFALSVLGGQYGDMVKSQPLFIIDDDTLNAIASATGMVCRRLPQMTVHPTRASYELIPTTGSLD